MTRSKPDKGPPATSARGNPVHRQLHLWPADSPQESCERVPLVPGARRLLAALVEAGALTAPIEVERKAWSARLGCAAPTVGRYLTAIEQHRLAEITRRAGRPSLVRVLGAAITAAEGLPRSTGRVRAAASALRQALTQVALLSVALCLELGRAAFNGAGRSGSGLPTAPTLITDPAHPSAPPSTPDTPTPLTPITNPAHPDQSAPEPRSPRSIVRAESLPVPVTGPVKDQRQEPDPVPVRRGLKSWWKGDITREQLSQPEAIEKLYQAAIAAGRVTACEDTRLAFYAICCCIYRESGPGIAQAKRIRRVGGILMQLIGDGSQADQQRWKARPTQVDEDQARLLLRGDLAPATPAAALTELVARTGQSIRMDGSAPSDSVHDQRRRLIAFANRAKSREEQTA